MCQGWGANARLKLRFGASVRTSSECRWAQLLVARALATAKNVELMRCDRVAFDWILGGDEAACDFRRKLRLVASTVRIRSAPPSDRG
jgi:hypothetical protein